VSEASDRGPGGDLASLVGAFLESYRDDPRAQFINKRYIPSRDEIYTILKLLLEVFYPGYFGRQDLTDENVAYHVGATLHTLREKLERQTELCLCYGTESGERASPDVPRCRYHGRAVVSAFMARLPEIRRRLVLDVQAAYDGDPAASGIDEVILAYPGLLAVTVYRVAHELYELGVPLMPRIMTEWAHAQTGCDIHPGATVGDSFFIDHATGVVIGATTHIGARVKLYQGVTLGALSMPRDAEGNLIRDSKRHPTLEDQVTIYANATVLGGETVIGKGSLLGGSVFITRSVPEGHRVALDPPKLRMVTPRSRTPESAPPAGYLPGDVDFDI
jgi:serine O-acetyltransferase